MPRVTFATDNEGVIEELLIALANYAAETNEGKTLPSVLDALVAGSGREAIRTMLGCTGHLVHYGAGDHDADRLTHLFEELILALRRGAASEPGAIVPGDLVELVTASPEDHLEAGAIMRVHQVGGDGTVDLGYASLVQDYLQFTVRLDQLRRHP